MAEEPQNSTPWSVIGIALAAAAGPAFFFANPLELHMQGDMRAYWGIAVFASAILAGIAFFREADFGWRRTQRFGSEVLAAAWIVALVASQVLLSVVFERWSSDMAAMRPLAELQKQIPLWAACGLVAGLFWQGLFQRNFADDVAPALRVIATTVAGVAIWLPFAINGTPEVLTHLAPSLLVGYLLAAILNELGAPVWSTMFWHAAFFAGLVWFRQALLL